MQCRNLLFSRSSPGLAFLLTLICANCNNDKFASGSKPNTSNSAISTEADFNPSDSSAPASEGNSQALTPTPIESPTLISPTINHTVTVINIEENASKLITVESVQLAPKAIDLLWVADNSNSLLPIYDNITSFFKTFISSLHNYSNIDIRLAITSMNMCQADASGKYIRDLANCSGVLPDKKASTPWRNGKLIEYNGANVFNVSSNKIVDNFIGALNLLKKSNADASGYEHGIEAANQVILNKEFFRPDAEHHFLFISDEEDQAMEYTKRGYIIGYDLNVFPLSPGSIMPPFPKDSTLQNGYLSTCSPSFPQKYIDRSTDVGPNITCYGFLDRASDFLTYNKSVQGFTVDKVHAITTFRDENSWVDDKKQFTHFYGAGQGTCHNIQVYESGTTYLQGALLTGGATANLCDPVSKWQENLQELASSMVLNSKFYLEKNMFPIIGTLKVRVNGELISDDKYKYDETQNIVVFKKKFLPTLNSRVVITYEPRI